MWTILQIGIALAVTFWLISLNQSGSLDIPLDGRAIGIASFLAAFAATFGISYFIDFCRTSISRLRQTRSLPPDSY